MTRESRSKPAAQAHAWSQMGFDLVSLRLVLAAAEAHSFAGAAQRENTSLSAVSRRIAEFEQRLGITLFDRHDRGVTLTGAGERFVDQLYDLFDRLELIALNLEAVRSGTSGLVRISAPMTPVAGDLPVKVAKFVQKYPGIDVHIVEEKSAVAIHAVGVGALDLALVPANISPPPGLTFIPWLDDELVVLLPKQHPLARKELIKLVDLADLPFVSMGKDSGLFAFYRHCMSAAGHRLRERAHTMSFESVRKMVAAGLGVAIAPATAAIPYATELDLVIRKLDETWARRPHVLCVREPERRSAATKLFIAYLTA